jgi:hypothetical protein
MKKIMFSIITLLAISTGVMSQNALTVDDILLPQTGQATLTVNFQFDAADTYASYQFNLELPSDLEFVMEEGTHAEYFMGDCHNGHTVTANLNEGLLKVAGLSSGKTLKGTSGILLQFTIKPKTSGLTIGHEYNCTIKDIVLTTKDAQIKPDDSNFKVTISQYTILDETSTIAPTASSGVDVLVKRTIKANEWSTICLPFAMTKAQVEEAFGDDVKLKDFTGYETIDEGKNTIGITVNFTSVTAIEKNHPYVIKVSNAISEFTVNNVEIDPISAPTVATIERTKKQWSELIGTYIANTVIDENCLFLSGNKFWYSNGSTKMKAFRAYFDFYDVLTEVEEASARIGFNFDETTGINEVHGNANVEGTYDLQGRKVEEPANKGLYIVNGHKVVIK